MTPRKAAALGVHVSGFLLARKSTILRMYIYFRVITRIFRNYNVMTHVITRVNAYEVHIHRNGQLHGQRT
jgi:hypothetical protein